VSSDGQTFLLLLKFNLFMHYLHVNMKLEWTHNVILLWVIWEYNWGNIKSITQGNWKFYQFFSLLITILIVRFVDVSTFWFCSCDMFCHFEGFFFKLLLLKFFLIPCRYWILIIAFSSLSAMMQFFIIVYINKLN
jgi:hypothetical protein